MSANLFALFFLVASVSARVVVYELDPEDLVLAQQVPLSEEYQPYDGEALIPEHFARVRRSPQIHIPPPPPDNQLKPIGNVQRDPLGRVTSQTVGLGLENVNGHSLAVTRTNIPGAGDRTAASGNFRLIDNDNHKLDANAFAAHTSPFHPQAPGFNTYGGGVDYMYKNTAGLEASMARTPLFDKTDYSAAAKLNLFNTPNSSFDMKAGAQRSISPYMPSSRWEPFGGFSYQLRF